MDCPHCPHSLADHAEGGPMRTMSGLVDNTTTVPCRECGCLAAVYAAIDESRPVKW
jgi:hypothetical protein